MVFSSPLYKRKEKHIATKGEIIHETIIFISDRKLMALSEATAEPIKLPIMT